MSVPVVSQLPPEVQVIADQIHQIYVRHWGVPSIGLETPLGDLGLTSVDCVNLVDELELAFKTHLVPVVLYEYPTIRALAFYLSGSGVSPPRVVEDIRYPFVCQASGEQEQMVILNQQGHPYIDLSTIQINGDLKIDRWIEAYHSLIKQHETLRTSFQLATGQVNQIIHQQPLPHSLVTEVSEEQVIAECRMMESIDLLTPVSPIKMVISKRSTDGYLVGIAIHHVCYDGYSVDLLVDQLSTLYRSPHSLQPLSLQYRDFAMWQNHWCSTSPEAQRQLDYWKKIVSNPFEFDLPYDLRTTVSVPTRIPIAIDSVTINQLSQSYPKQTLFEILLTIYHIFLCRISRHKEVSVTIPFHGRTRPGLDQLIGYFVKVLPTRTPFTMDDTLHTAMNQMSQLIQLTLKHSELPLSWIGHSCQLDQALFKTFFTVQNYRPKDLDLGLGLTATVSPLTSVPKFELAMILTHETTGITGYLEYDPHLFSHSMMTAMMEVYRHLVNHASRCSTTVVSHIPLLNSLMSQQIVRDGTHTPLLHEMFEQQVRRSPQATALIHGSQQWTFQEVDVLATRVASRLVSSIPETKIVGVVAINQPNYIWTILGVLKAGCAFMPLSIEQPDDRIHSMLNQSQCSTVMVTDQTFARFGSFQDLSLINVDQIPDIDRVVIDRVVDPHQCAYVLGTSGSTGHPKLVMISHLSISRLTDVWNERFFDSQSRTALTSSTSFDASIQFIFAPLTCGATLVIPNHPLYEIDAIHRTIIDHQLTNVFFVPSLLRSYLQKYKNVPDCLEYISLGGEEVRYEMFDGITWGSKTRIINGYGPTEATIATTTYVVRAQELTGKQGAMPIGRPLRTHRVYVVDQTDSTQLTPLGCVGELYIGGECLSLGYLGQPEETSQRFVANPFGSGSLYRTGDLVKWIQTDQDSQRQLVFMGRVDTQIKLRGHRIELGEIESVIRHCSGVLDVVVTIREQQIVAYVILSADLSITPLFIECTRQLPSYMIPSAIVRVNQFPTMLSGKTNHKMLPAPTISDYFTSEETGGPMTSTEHKLVTIWSRLLGHPVDSLKTSSNFLNSGGHSLLAMSLATQISQEFQIPFPVVHVMKNPVLREMATLIDQTIITTVDHQRKHVVIVPGGIPVTTVFNDLVQHLGSDVHVTILNYSSSVTTMDQMIESFLTQLDGSEVDLLIGYCLGAIYAHELLQVLPQKPKKFLILNGPVDVPESITHDQVFFKLSQLLALSLGVTDESWVERLKKSIMVTRSRDDRVWCQSLLETFQQPATQLETMVQLFQQSLTVCQIVSQHRIEEQPPLDHPCWLIKTTTATPTPSSRTRMDYYVQPCTLIKNYLFTPKPPRTWMDLYIHVELIEIDTDHYQIPKHLTTLSLCHKLLTV